MHILIVTRHPPSIYSGTALRLLNLIKPLAERHQFTVIAQINQIDQPILEHADRYCHFIPVSPLKYSPPRSRGYWRLVTWRQALLDANPRIVNEFYSPLIQQVVAKQLLCGSFDIIHVQQLTMAKYLPRKKILPSILDVDDLWSKLFPRLSQLSAFKASANNETGAQNQARQRFTHRFLDYLDSKKIPIYEKRILRRFDICLAISPEDERIIQGLAPNTWTTIIPNGVDCKYFDKDLSYEKQPVPEKSPVILFTGTMSWLPNVDAVRYFSHDILPIIRQQFPDAQFVIAGNRPAPDVQKLAEDPGITVTGFVKDIRPFIAGCTVFVVPLRAGAGSRLKILEALAMSKPVVSTMIGAEGLQVTPWKDILIADDPAQFADLIINVINNPDLSKPIGENGHKLVTAQYDWSIIAKRLEQTYQYIVERRTLDKP